MKALKQRSHGTWIVEDWFVNHGLFLDRDVSDVIANIAMLTANELLEEP
jgi:hypothetical protein